MKELIHNGVIGKIINVQVRFACPPRDVDFAKPDDLPWRLHPEISGGGYFYDLAPHQLDLLQEYFGIIVDAKGICANRGGLYSPEDTLSACFEFESGLPGSGSWCFVGHEAAKEDRVEVIGDRGLISFSVFNYKPIHLVTTDDDVYIDVPNPPYVQLPIIEQVIRHLQGFNVCECTSVSATPTNWVLDRILGKF